MRATTPVILDVDLLDGTCLASAAFPSIEYARGYVGALHAHGLISRGEQLLAHATLQIIEGKGGAR